MASVDPWAHIQPAFLDPWFTDLLSRDTDPITKTLHNSLFSEYDPLSPFPFVQPKTSPMPDVLSGSVLSDPESAPKRPNNPIPVAPAAPRGRVSKRKSRASKRCQTTFIAADAANFRQMVQQVTGIGLIGTHGLVLKPEPQRATIGLLPPLPAVTGGGLNLITDASAWRQNPGRGLEKGPSPLVAATPAVADSGVAGFPGLDLLAGFPTLESWKAI